MTKQRLTVCFADIDRFNVAMRNMSLDDLVTFLQGFYERAGSVLISHNGRLIKYIGDAVLATFEPGREEVAVRAMWTLRESYRDYADNFGSDAQVSSLRAGIATGQVVAGQLGHPQMLAYDVLGKTVTVASALMRCGGVTIDGATYDPIAERIIAEPAEVEGEVRGYRVTGFR